MLDVTWAARRTFVPSIRRNLPRHAADRLRPLLSLRRAHRIAAGARARAPAAGRDRIDRQEPRGPRHLGADGHQPAPPARGRSKPAFWVDGNIHSTEVAASVAASTFSTSSSRNTARMPTSRVRSTPAPSTSARASIPTAPNGRSPTARSGYARARAPIRSTRKPIEGLIGRGHRRRRAHPADAHRRSERHCGSRTRRSRD